MEHHAKGGGNYSRSEEELMELRRGPWTVEEDLTLINYIAHHGEGRWNSLATCAGKKTPPCTASIINKILTFLFLFNYLELFNLLSMR